jgi:hypothetical protein
VAVLVDLVVARSDQGAAAVAAQVHRAVRVEVLLLLRQVVAAETGCGAEVRCGSAEVVAAVLLPD